VAAILRAILSKKAKIHLTPSVKLNISQDNGRLNVRNRLRTAKFHTQNISAKCPSKPVPPFWESELLINIFNDINKISLERLYLALILYINGCEVGVSLKRSWSRHFMQNCFWSL